MSFGTTEDTEALHSVIKKAYDSGILLVAAAGNTGDKTNYPAAYDEVIAVGSIGIDGTISEFSAKDEFVEVFAPGEMIESTGALSGTIRCDGTSMAAAHVSAVAACIWSEDLTKSAEFIRSVLLAGANKIDEDLSAGLIDYEYSMEVYEHIEKLLKEKEIIEENVDKEMLEEILNEIPKNDNVIQKYSEAVIEAAWSGHKELVADISTNSAMQEGAYFPDSVSSGLSGMLDNPLWHARRTKNSFVTYRYLVKVGNAVRSLSSSATSTSIKNAIKSVGMVTGQSVDDYEQLQSDLCTNEVVINKIIFYRCE